MFLGQIRPVHPVTESQLLRSIDPTGEGRPERKYRDASKLARSLVARVMSDERAREEPGGKRGRRFVLLSFEVVE